MKRFKQHLLEKVKPQWQESVWDFVHGMAKMIPLSSKMLDRLMGKKRINTFHVFGLKRRNDIAGDKPSIVGLENFKNMYKIQGTKKAISSFTDMEYNYFEKGIWTGGGVLSVLESDLQIAFPNDLMSRPDKQGRRWINISKLSEYSFVDNSIDLKPISDIESSMEDVKDKMFYDNNYTPKYNDKIDGKTKAKLIKEFFDSVEKILMKHKDYLKKLFFKISVAPNRLSRWNELVVNNFKIIDLYINVDVAKYIHEEGLENEFQKYSKMSLKDMLKKGKILRNEKEFNDVLKRYQNETI